MKNEKVQRRLMPKLLFKVVLPDHPILDDVISFLDDGTFTRANSYTEQRGFWRYQEEDKYSFIGKVRSPEGIRLSHNFDRTDWSECQRIIDKAYFKYLDDLIVGEA